VSKLLVSYHHYAGTLNPHLQSELNASIGESHRLCEGGKLADRVRCEIRKKLRFDGKHDETLQSQLRRLPDGRATCRIPINSFLGQPKGAQTHCFVGLRLLLVLVGRHDFHMDRVCHLERLLSWAMALSQWPSLGGGRDQAALPSLSAAPSSSAR
jgi:hypothetical protein